MPLNKSEGGLPKNIFEKPFFKKGDDLSSNNENSSNDAPNSNNALEGSGNPSRSVDPLNSPVPTAAGTPSNSNNPSGSSEQPKDDSSDEEEALLSFLSKQDLAANFKYIEKEMSGLDPNDPKYDELEKTLMKVAVAISKKMDDDDFEDSYSPTEPYYNEGSSAQVESSTQAESSAQGEASAKKVETNFRNKLSYKLENNVKNLSSDEIKDEMVKTSAEMEEYHKSTVPAKAQMIAEAEDKFRILAEEQARRERSSFEEQGRRERSSSEDSKPKYEGKGKGKDI